MANTSEIQKSIIVKCYIILLEMVEFEHLIDDELLIKDIQKIEDMEPFLPTAIFKVFKSFICVNIDPIIDNPQRFSEFMDSEVGFVNDKGVFEFRDEYGLNLFMARICKYSIDLRKTLNNLAIVELSPYIL